MQSYDKTLAIVGSAVLGACLVAGGIATLGKDLSVVESPALKFAADASATEPLKRQDSAGKAQAINAEQKAAEQAAAEKAAAEQAAADQAAAQRAEAEAAAARTVTEVPAPQPKHVAPTPKSNHDWDRWDGDRDRGRGDHDGDRWGGDRDRGGHDRGGHDRGGHGGGHDRGDRGGHGRH